MRKGILAATALVAVVAFFLLATLPPRPAELQAAVDETIRQRTVAGAYHVHTTRSDGAEDRASIAAAAGRAGLQFVIFTDHGDATRRPDPPEYQQGVLCIDGVEISTNGGHYVALGLPSAPYPLGGDAAAVVEDVARLGGFGIAAHPHHPKPSLSWGDWSAPIDGIEWVNADAEWRNESTGRLARVLFDYLFRPAPALASVFERPDQTLRQWEALLTTRPVVALAAADAHGGARGSSLEEGGSRFAIGPSYEASFRTLSNHVLLDAPLTGNALDDERRLLRSLRQGRVYTVIQGIAHGAVLVPRGPRGELRFPGDPPAGITVRELGVAPQLAMEATHPNAPGSLPLPWVVANPIVSEGERVPALPLTVPLGAPLASTSAWRIEKDAGSNGTVAGVPGGIQVTYHLREGDRVSQFVAAATDVALGNAAAVVFSGRAERPMRVSVQVRFPQEGERFIKSVYLDDHEREVVVPFTEMTPAERALQTFPDPGRAGSVLFVVDLTNARPGQRGSFTIGGLRTLAQSPAAPR